MCSELVLELVRTALDQAERLENRLRCTRELGQVSPDEEDTARDALIRLATDRRTDPILGYAAGTSVARLPHGVLDNRAFADFTEHALWGYEDESGRIAAQRTGRFSEVSRLSVAVTKDLMDVALDLNRPPEERALAIERLGNAHQDLEQQALTVLVQIASNRHEPATVARSAGVAVARLRVPQGIADNLLLADFREDAFEAYDEEGARLGRRA